MRGIATGCGHGRRWAGAESLKPHELIELLLFYAIPRRNVNALAHALIERFGSANGVLTADEKALREVEGVGAHTARVLCAIGRLCRAYADLRARIGRCW